MGHVLSMKNMGFYLAHVNAPPFTMESEKIQ